MPQLELSCALSLNERTRPLLDGSVVPDGIALNTTTLSPGEMFYRQLKFGDFDVSEMSLASFTIARSHGDTEWLGLPVFTMRRFFHTGIWVRAGAGIEKPADLRGKRVGVPEFQQTAVVWIRAVLQDEFGLDPRDMEWFMERGPEVSPGGSTGFTPPAGVTFSHVPADTNLGAMLLDGSLDAVLFYVVRNNFIDRSRVRFEDRSDVHPLFPDPAAEGRRYYAKTGLFPINHCCVVRRSLAERHPWIVLNLYNAFVAAKAANATARAGLLEPFYETGLLAPEARADLARDPLAYGVRAARPEVETITRALHDQGLVERVVGLDE